MITAGTAGPGVEKLATEPVDGIFLDVKMPDLDGLAAWALIRRRDSRRPLSSSRPRRTTMPPQTPWPAEPMPMS